MKNSDFPSVQSVMDDLTGKSSLKGPSAHPPSEKGTGEARSLGRPVRVLPEQSERVETGPIRFGNDWTGLFIRGDQAAYFLSMFPLKCEYEHSLQEDSMRYLCSLLESTNEARHPNDQISNGAAKNSP